MKKIIKIILLIIVYMSILSISSTVNAASASIKTNKTSMEIGETATITVTINAAAWNIKVTGATTKNIVGYSEDGENTSKTEKITFKPTSTGKYTINLGGDTTDGTTFKTENVSGSVTIEVKEKSTTPENNPPPPTTTTTQEKSNVATLSNLGITPYKYDFNNFKKTVTKYNITVPNEAESIKIYATATHSKATISGTGTKKLKEGKNTFTVKVTAEDKKTTKTYTLNITREEKETIDNPEENNQTNTQTNEEKPIEEPNTNEETIEGIKNILIEGYTLSPAFNNKIYEYSLNINEDISKLDIKTELSSEDYELNIAGNEELKAGENVITLLVHNKKNDVTTTYQIIANKKEKANQNIDVTEINGIFSEAQQKYKTKELIAIGTIILIIILLIIFIIVRHIIKSRINNKTDNIIQEEDELFDEEKIKKYKKSKKGNRYK